MLIRDLLTNAFTSTSTVALAVAMFGLASIMELEVRTTELLIVLSVSIFIVDQEPAGTVSISNNNTKKLWFLL